MAVLGDVFDDRLGLLLLVTQSGECLGYRLIDDLHGAATDQLLELDERKVRLDTGRIAVHHEPNSSSRRQNAGLSISPTIFLTDPETILPRLGSSLLNSAVIVVVGADQIVGCGVLAHDPLVRLSVASIALVWPDNPGKFRGTPVRGAGHQRGNRGRQSTSTIGVVGVTGGHQQRP